MTAPWKISIRSKILLVLSAVVILAVAMYVYLASRIFYEDKTLLIYELNQTNVQTLGAEVETEMRGILDKLRTVAALSGGASPSGALSQVLEIISDGSQGFVRIGQISQTGVNQVLWTRADPLKIYGQNVSYLDLLPTAFPIPVAKVLHDGIWIRNATLAQSPGQGEENPPIMTVAVASPPSVIYVDVMLNPLAKVFERDGIAKTRLIDSEGYVLVRSDGGSGDFSRKTDDPLWQAAQASKVRSELRTFRDGDDSYLGSFYKVGVGGLVVESKISSAEAFSAARLLMRKSLLYALIVVTAAFLVSLFFSHSLTVPIEKLVEATRRIAQGDFNRLVSVSSGDELAVLASSFNTMTVDLKSSHEKIQEYSRTLEDKVADRTAKLEAQNVAIRETQEALVRTTRLASVGEIAGRAAHEVLNPLTSITTRLEKIRNLDLGRESQDFKLIKEIAEAWARSFREGGGEGLLKSLSTESKAHPGKTLLEEDLLNLEGVANDAISRSDARRSDFDFLLRECARISKIVNGMRQLTRVSGSRKRIRIHVLLDEALGSVGDLLSKNGIAMERAFQPEGQSSAGGPEILADHDELLQVFSNLFRNSIQALQQLQKDGAPPQWVPKIRVATSLAGRRVQIRVADNGIGVAAGNRDRIFEPSFTTKSMEEGTGLGLSIARRFVRAYDGEIVLEKSERAKETVFMIELPEVPNDA